ncbi:MAG: hypothetical protein QW717_06555 [Candidatus Bathyarchaeia archaeon]
MRLRIPPKKICEKFLITYELEGCQKAVNFLASYYGIRKMKIVLNGKKVGKGSYKACYDGGKAYFRKQGLNKRVVLHELYHHIVAVYPLEMSRSEEEKEANRFAKEVLCRGRTF